MMGCGKNDSEFEKIYESWPPQMATIDSLHYTYITTKWFYILEYTSTEEGLVYSGNEKVPIYKIEPTDRGYTTELYEFYKAHNWYYIINLDTGDELRFEAIH